MKANPEKSKPNRERNERQDWAIVFVILLLGLCCVAGAGQYALRVSPNWRLDADMASNLDLNSEFLTGKPVAYFEPLNPDILTQPSWANGNIFLTPGASIVLANRTPLPTSDSSITSVPTALTTATPVVTGVTNTVAVTASPTNTLVWIPIPATKTSKAPNTSVPPANTATNTSPAPAPSADLQISQTDSTAIYIPGSSLTYTIFVSNPGPSSVIGATVTDAFPTQISGASWTCVSTGGATCTAGSGTGINDVINLPAGSSVTYTVNAPVNITASGSLTNTVSVNMPAGYTELNGGNNTFPDTNTNGSTSANLSITNTDNATHYTAGGTTTYTITVTNTGTADVVGANVTFPTAQISGISWTCARTGSATCTDGSGININDVVNLPNGGSITYTVIANISGTASGPLANTASVALPAGYTGTGSPPISAIDTDQPIVAASVPPAEIGETRSCGNHPAGLDCTYELGWDGFGGTLTWTLITPITLSGNNNPDLVYYERPSTGAGILMDWVIIRISDGHNWYTVLDWGNQYGGGTDSNTNIAGFTPESDNLPIPYGALYNGTGITINIDGMVGTATGPFPYIQIIAPPDGDDGIAIDGVGPYP